MCLVKTISRDNWMKNKLPKIRYAQKEIKVYKVLEVEENPMNNMVGYFSPYESFQYKEGYHYSEDSLIVDKDTFGWHDHTQYYAKVSMGFHAYTSLKHAKAEWEEDTDITIIEMHIPVGAEYLKGDDSEIVSTELIWYKGAKIHHI